MKKLKIGMALLFLLTIALTSLLWSGTTGKIAGKVTDKTNGEPIIGANIVVVGTSLGAVTDIDGDYSILLVPPGTYNVSISYIGYKKIVLTNVHIFIDQTARVSIALEPEAVEVGETVVLGERPIKMDVATSVVDVSGSDIGKLAATNVDDIVNMQAGIKDNNLRGSGMDQALFMVDGATMRDPRNNTALTKVALSSVKEVSVERGGVTAEYGQVQSGVIKVVTNEGKTKGYSASVSVKMTPPARKYFQGAGMPDIQDPTSYWLRPYLDPAVCWTGTTNGAWDSYTRSQYLSFQGGWNAISKALCTDNNPNNDLTPEGAQRAFLYETRKSMFLNQPDYDIDGGLGGPVPFISEPLGNLRFFASYRTSKSMLLFPTSRPDYSDYDGRLVVTSDLSRNMKLQIVGSLGNVATMEDNWNRGNYLNYPYQIYGGTGGDALVNLFGNFAYALTDIDHRSLSAKLTHMLSDKTYYEVSLEYFRTHYFSRPPAARDTSVLYEVLSGFYETSNPDGYYSGKDLTGVLLQDGSQDALARDNTVSSATTFKANMTSQVDSKNMVKGGIEFTYDDLNLDYGFMNYPAANQDDYSSHVQMHNYPIQGGAFLQDKLETEGFTMNAGVRVDYSDARTDWWSFNPFDYNFYSSAYSSQRIFAVQTTAAQWAVSPRFGISHPITENSKLYFNYGHYKEMPQFDHMFEIERRQDHSLARIGNPNLPMAKTISYELGYDHQLFDNQILLQITAFYRDINDQQNFTKYYPASGQPFYATNANGYQDTRGFEVTLKKTLGPWFYGFINYTYQATSKGQFDTIEIHESVTDQVQLYDEVTSLYYQQRIQPAPFARADLNFSTPKDFGPIVFGHHIFGDWMANLLLNWNAGGATTFNPKQITGVDNNVEYVDYFDGRLRISKGISFKNLNIQLFADISNLFNAKRLQTGYNDISNSGAYINSLHLPQSNAYNNVPGNDKIGDYRDPSVDWQPMYRQDDVQDGAIKPGDRAIYYDGRTKTYWQTQGSAWVQVDQGTIDKINSTKAYIQMPNPSTFWFLNPRNITFGISASLDID